MDGGSAMGLGDFSLDSETTVVPSYFLICFNPNGEGRDILDT